MTALRVLVADDEPLARARLRRLLAACRDPEAIVLGEAADGADVLAQLERASVDVVLLDVAMPGLDGMGVAQRLQTQPNAPVVAFITAHAEHALQAFELDAADYLTKPVRQERLQAALEKARRLLRARSPRADNGAIDSLLITASGLVKRVPLSEVLYLKAELKYVTVGTAHESYVLDGSLNQLEADYPDYFLRVHRNTLVVKRAIRALQRRLDADGNECWVVRLGGVDEAFSVSRRQVAAVRATLGQSPE